jgi:uncharacterized protein YciU (UPF0263 family)
MSWPKEYINSETNKLYKPHHEEEKQWVEDSAHAFLLAKGGEGGGKSVAGIVRDLERIRYGASGIVISPDFEHFKRSLWPEFRNWCPWDLVVEKQQYRQSKDWEPGRPFQMVFQTGAVVYFGGAKESDIEAWEGPNVNWAHFDECRRHKTPAALKMIVGRVRIPAHKDDGTLIPPQLWLTTTPRMHWLYDYFGPPKDNDPKANFKAKTSIMTLLTADNIENLSEDFLDVRAAPLTAAEIRVLLEAEWEDIGDSDYFLATIDWWDVLKRDIGPPTKESLVIGVDAAIGRANEPSDCFGMVVVSRDPDNNDGVAVRFVHKWQAKAGQQIQYDGPDSPAEIIRYLCNNYSVAQVAYDPKSLEYLCGQVLNKELQAWFYSFPQQSKRLEADKQLLDLITQRRIIHNGNPDLREHINNSNRKLTDDGHRLRIVKREESLKIDLAVALSMAAYECLRLNL